MATNTITFGGNVLPCTIERFPTIRKPARKYRRFNIPGRNGDLFFQENAYENVIQEYQVYAGSDQQGVQVPWYQMAKLLYLDGYQTLQDTYDGDHFRKAVFNGPIDIENAWNTHGRATLEFDCRPERFLQSGKQAISYPHSSPIPIDILNLTDLAENLQTQIQSDYPDGGTQVALFTFISDWGGDLDYSKFYLSNAAPTSSYVGYAVATGTATGEEATSIRKLRFTPRDQSVTTRNYIDFSSSMDIVIPINYLVGDYPVLAFSYTTEPYKRYFGAAGALVNNYMASHPLIVLHRISSHQGTVSACKIGAYGITITYDSDYAYYFIDTENFTATKTNNLSDDPILAQNVRIDAGIQLEPGVNQIYTSEWYEMELTPNWWEL